MPNRTILCPECDEGRIYPRGYFVDEGSVMCAACNGTGWLTDRRAPTAADRAVERIKERCIVEAVCDVFHAVGGGVLANEMLDIIREEEGR